MSDRHDHERVVLITGGASGIGLSLAEAFMRSGASVAVCGRSKAALDQFADAHPTSLAFQADVTDSAARHAMLDAVVARFGRLDVLVNNAGVFVERNFAEDRDAFADLQREVEINLLAPIQLTNEVLNRWPAIAAIVFVTSGFGFISPTRAPTYGASKAGLHNFAEGLRRQISPKTHVLELVPPNTDTPMNADFAGKKMSPQDVAAVAVKALERRKPMAMPGPTKFLPLLLRIAPNTITRIVAKM
jgi:uncharacterized oxidoreductase